MSTKTLCFTCKHYKGDFKCKAFGNKPIPTVIFSGDNNHDEPLDLQTNDIVFEPTPDANDYYKAMLKDVEPDKNEMGL